MGVIALIPTAVIAAAATPATIAVATTPSPNIVIPAAAVATPTAAPTSIGIAGPA